jgi:hypothetical protein
LFSLKSNPVFFGYIIGMSSLLLKPKQLRYIFAILTSRKMNMLINNLKLNLLLINCTKEGWLINSTAFLINSTVKEWLAVVNCFNFQWDRTNRPLFFFISSVNSLSVPNDSKSIFHLISPGRNGITKESFHHHRYSFFHFHFLNICTFFFLTYALFFLFE